MTVHSPSDNPTPRQRISGQPLGLMPLAIVVLMWQLYGCATPANDRQVASQPAEPPAQIQLQWTPPTAKADGRPLTDIAGYKIHYGQRSRTYAFVKDVGNQTSAALSGLVPGRTYFFAVSAYDSAGNESSLSDEVSKVAPPTPTATPMLMQDALARGQACQFWVAGVGPGEVVSYLYSTSGAGEGPCSPQLGGLCVDLLDPQVFGEATADETGTAILTYTIPPEAPLGQTIAVQAVIRRGPDGAQSVKTNVITSRVTE